MMHFRFSLSVIALLAAGTAPAMSETLAADLWAEWQAQATQSGQSMTATVTETDTGLVLTGVVTVMQQDGMGTSATLDQIEMIENADGTVSVVLSEPYSLVVTFETDPGDPPANIELLMNHENLDLTVSGDPGNRTYAYSADSITLTEGRIWGGGDEPPGIDLDVAMTDLAATYTLTGTANGTDPIQFTSEGSAGRFTMVLDVSGPPSDPGRAKVGLFANDISSTSSGTILALAALNQVSGAFPEGLAIAGSTSYGAFGMEFALDVPEQEFEMVYSNTGGNIGVGFSDAGISYEIASTGMATHMAGSEFPVPVDFASTSSALSFSIPLAAAPDPQDVSARIAIDGLTMSDALWGMMDPGQAIPRNPATLVLDANGLVQILVDLASIDPETMTAPPGELRALTVNELRVSVGGAVLSGTADMTFAPNQIVPMPVGEANLNLSGGNALLDALIAGGMVPADQGAFVRGMANVFARPGAAPDTLESVVVFGPDGSITANGIPLQ